MKELPFARLWAELDRQTFDQARQYWDLRADEFNDITRDQDRQERLELVSYLEERGALAAEHSVLDIGCGAGRFALEFARRTRRVTGIDISPRMIAHAEENFREAGLDKATFMVAPWQEIELDAHGFRAGFDLVFASMSAAVDSERSLLKLHAASRCCCFASGFIQRKDLLQQTLADRLFPGLALPPLGGSIYYAFNVLWQNGIYADLTCKDVSWTNDWDVQTAANVYAEQLRTYALPGRDLRADVLRELERLAEAGRVRRRMEAKTAWLFWKVGERGEGRQAS